MLLAATLFAALVLALPTFTVLWIRLRLAKDDVARRSVPVLGTAVVFGALTVSAVLAGFIASNIQATDEGLVTRGRAGFEAATLSALGSTDPEGPAADIGGGARLSDEQLGELGAGREIALPTTSGKPATLQLFSIGGEDRASVRYDGADLKLDIEPIGDVEVRNDGGYPQLMPLAPLPSRS